MHSMPLRKPNRVAQACFYPKRPGYNLGLWARFSVVSAFGEPGQVAHLPAT